MIKIIIITRPVVTSFLLQEDWFILRVGKGGAGRKVSRVKKKKKSYVTLNLLARDYSSILVSGE